MAHRVHVFSRELNAIDNVKHDKEKCNRIIDEEGMELVHCIGDNVSQGNIPLEYDKERLKMHKECLRKLVNKTTSYRGRQKLIPEGGFLGSPHPYTCRISRRTVHGQ